MSYIVIKWQGTKAYKIMAESKWDKDRKTSTPKVVKYLGKATIADIKKYYHGKKIIKFQKELEALKNGKKKGNLQATAS